MHRCDSFRSLNLQHKLIRDENIQPIPHIGQLLPSIDKWHRHFDLYIQPRLRKFKREASLVRAFQQTRPKRRMNFESTVQSDRAESV